MLMNFERGVMLAAFVSDHQEASKSDEGIIADNLFTAQRLALVHSPDTGMYDAGKGFWAEIDALFVWHLGSEAELEK